MHRFRTKRPNAADTARRKQYTSPEHRNLKAAIQRRIDTGEIIRCWRCGVRVHARAWHLGHDDHDRTIYKGAECIPCNLTAAARKGNRIARARKATLRPVRRRTLL